MEIRSFLTNALREAAIISVSATVLGFAYTFVAEKGIFSPAKPATQSLIPNEAVPPQFVSYEEALKFFEEGSALFVDARHAYDYNLGHIEGAINVPLKDFHLDTSPLAKIPKNQPIVTYCDGAECNSSIELGKKLSEEGFTKVYMFFGGWNEWQTQHRSSP